MPNARCLGACLLFLATPSAFAADGWATESRIDMSGAEFRAANEQFFGKGMRLVDITVAEVKGRPVIGATWNRLPGSPAGSPEHTKKQLALVVLKKDEMGLQALARELGASGSQVEVVDAYQADGKTWFAASFSPPGETPMQTIGAFLTKEEVGKMRESAHDHDNELVRIEAYFEDGEYRYLPVFVARGESVVETDLLETTLQVQAAVAKRRSAGMSPLSISAIDKGGSSGFLVAFDASDANRELVYSDRGDQIRKKIAAGAYVIDLDSQAGSDGNVYYYAALHTP